MDDTRGRSGAIVLSVDGQGGWVYERPGPDIPLRPSREEHRRHDFPSGCHVAGSRWIREDRSFNCRQFLHRIWAARTAVHAKTIPRIYEEGVPFDMEAFVRIVDSDLPIYARPVFLRIQRSVAITGTFKLLKGEVREQAYHLDQVGDDEIYVRRPQGESYERLDVGFYKSIADGSAGY